MFWTGIPAEEEVLVERGPGDEEDVDGEGTITKAITPNHEEKVTKDEVIQQGLRNNMEEYEYIRSALDQHISRLLLSKEHLSTSTTKASSTSSKPSQSFTPLELQIYNKVKILQSLMVSQTHIAHPACDSNCPSYASLHKPTQAYTSLRKLEIHNISPYWCPIITPHQEQQFSACHNRPDCSKSILESVC
jgi:hypothetical protein